MENKKGRPAVAKEPETIRLSLDGPYKRKFMELSTLAGVPMSELLRRWIASGGPASSASSNPPQSPSPAAGAAKKSADKARRPSPGGRA